MEKYKRRKEVQRELKRVKEIETELGEDIDGKKVEER
jgi:hypothetical protein